MNNAHTGLAESTSSPAPGTEQIDSMRALCRESKSQFDSQYN